MYRKFYESLLSQAGGTWFDFEGLIRDIYAALLRPGDVAVDAGAHKGDHTLQMAQAVAPDGRVIAIEAAPELVKALAALLQTSFPQLAEIVDIREVGLSDRHGTATFYYAPEAPGLSGLRNRGQMVPGPLVEFTVDLAPLDFICQSAPGPIRFMKIDIEGAEFDALRGGRQTILRDRPVIVFEHDRDSPRHFLYSIEDLVGLIRSLDYHVYDFFNNSYDVIDAWSDTMMWNFVALPEEYGEAGKIFGAVRRTLSGQFPAMLA
jgi:FkbM family methyltransferase